MRRDATTSPPPKLALDGDGRFLALDVDIIADIGAYLSAFAPFIPWLGVGMAPGVYDIPICHVRVRGAFTHTVPVDAYRGAGRPEAAYLIERLVDFAARELEVEPDALRRKNFIRKGALPYTTATGKVYDSGDFAGAPEARAGDRRLGRFQAPAGGVEEGRAATRHRDCDLHRGLRQQRPRHGDAAA